ncbi:hypothetical protein [Nitrosomonas communis]|uniref:hypothetical protein n=1 Tax=Nitrosomonas communis TaxID=44574 RepID=UPI0026EC0E00|nr:hypothetical protein [Nitrosomonas communis]MCO6428084.1 hypothetical protein [Nitrosomonas communis]
MSRKASRHVTSGLIDIEKQSGISITTSVIQFGHKKCILNLRNIPGHEVFWRMLIVFSPPSIRP